MKNTAPEERNSKTFAFLVIVALVISVLMRGVNPRFDVPHILYIAVAIICGAAGIISYSGFVYCKIFKSFGSGILPDMIKIILLGVMAYFTASFSLGVISEI
jgi:hypothetical protein